MRKYPLAESIKRHKDAVWTSMVQYFSGYVPLDNVGARVRELMGDAALWVNNNHKELDLEKVKKQIATLTLKEMESR